MSFPNHLYTTAKAFMDDYTALYQNGASSLDVQALEQAMQLLLRAYAQRHAVYVCGNGGSAAIANHWTCDHCKGVQTDTGLRPIVHSLSSNLELITAVANDIAYDEIFVYQLRTLANPGDVLITVSSSGNSENIVRAIQWARDNGVSSIALTGFSGGRSAKLADVNLHVAVDNYGVVEDLHQSLMHIMAQFVRQTSMNEAMITQRTF